MVDFDTQRVLRKNRVRRRGIYILPNLFTLAALFAGFYAIVQAMNLRFDQAAVAIFVAMVMDGLDGRVARMTRHAERVRRRVRQPGRHGELRRGAGAHRLRVGAEGHGQARLDRCLPLCRGRGAAGLRASTRCSRSRTSAGSPACRARPRRRSSPVWCGSSTIQHRPGRRSGMGACGNRLRRPHDGQQRPVLQLQVDQSAQERSIPRGADLRARDRACCPTSRRSCSSRVSSSTRCRATSAWRGTGSAGGPQCLPRHSGSGSRGRKALLLRQNCGYSASQ